MHTRKIQDGLMGTLCIRIFILLLSSSFCKSSDELTHTKPLFPGDKLISKGGDFALGFFSPDSSNSSLYLGIWYNNIPERTYVWVANRDKPISASSSTALAISNSSGMVLFDSNGYSVWTTMSNSTARGAGAYAVLLNTGNFVLQLPNGTETWQSFDHPTDTLLPTMRFVMSYKAQVVGRLVSWKSQDNPSSGDFSYSSDPSSPTLQAFVWHRFRPYYRGVSDDASVISAGMYLGNSSSMLFATQAELRDEFYFVFTVSPDSPFTRMILDYKGRGKFLVWNNHSSSWTIISERPANTFDLYARCGPFSYSDFTGATPTCRCLDGFEPDGLNFSRGCRRIEELECDKQSQFVTLPGMRVPDKFLHIMNRSFQECTAECSNNCSCTAYAYANLSNIGPMADPSRCLVWLGELIDARKVTGGGEPLYIRLAGSHDKKRSSIKIVLPIIACLLLLTCIALVWICKYRGKRRKKEIQKKMVLGYFSNSNELQGKNTELPFISFEDILSATNMFSDSNLLGQGGFGKVYKGTLEDGNEVAVKRLSKGSGQGILEYRNEVLLIAKLQHKNLVRLLGCCIHEDEKLLIYEYLPNKSLDVFLFDVARKYELDWSARFKIIKGIARGLLYLHQDSRLTIVHRDLKASNILLDTEMTPKISDFGMARIFGANQNQANTTRVVGTYGYMSPEYVTGGAFSVKSDTYSFGVLLLEIVSGFKISSPQLIPNFCSLITYAWRTWENGKATELVDSSFVDSCPLHEVLRCIHVGLLCVQDRPDDRPLMSFVMVTLENESVVLPAPKQPVYFALGNCECGEAKEGVENSANAMSVTTLEGR